MWLVTPVLALVLAQALPSRLPPRLDCRMECVLDDGVQDRLQVELRVTGLDPNERDLAFELPRWGEWIDVDEYYVTRVSGEPPVKHDLVNRFYWRPELPAAWNGSLTMRYSIPIVAFGSAVQQLRGLLPWRTPTYVHVFSVNTLMRMLVVGRFEDADRHLELVAPAGMSVATGWAGVTEGRQSIALEP